MRDLKIIAAIGLAVVVGIFILQNIEPVEVRFLTWSWSASRSLVLLLVFVAGVAAGWLGRAARHRRR